MRIVRRFIHAFVLVLMLIVGATAAIVIVSQTSWFKNWLRVYIVREAGQYLNGTLSIDRLGGNLFFGIELENVGVSVDGSQVVAVQDLGIDYNLFELVSSGLSVDNIRLNKPVLYLRRDGDGWAISRLIRKEAEEADREGPTRPIALDAIEVTDGEVVVDGAVGTSGVALPKRFNHLDAKLAFKYEPVRYSIDITQISFRGADPALALNAMSGGLSVRDDTIFIDKLALRTAESSMSVDGAVQNYLTAPVFNVQVSSDKLSIPELAPLVPALAGIRLQPAFEMTLNGPADHLAVDMNVRSTAGQLMGHLVADVEAPKQSLAGTVSVRRLDLSSILNDTTKKSDITADATLDLFGAPLSDMNSLKGIVSLSAPRIVAAGVTADQVQAKARIDGRRIAVDGRATAYGASATAAGRVVLPEQTNGSVAFDLTGRARRIDLRRLPRNLGLPAAATDINGDYHVNGSVSGAETGAARDLKGDVRFARSTIAGATVSEGSTAAVDASGGELAYRTDATVADLNLRRIGEEFRVPALAADRYESSINGHVTASGHGTTVRTLDVAANGTLQDTSILGGRIPQLSFDASMRDEAAHLKATGSFTGFDPAQVSGREALNGSVAGSVDLDATVTEVSTGVTPESVTATAKIQLNPSTVGGLDIATGTIDGDYRDSVANLRTVDITGRDLNVRASGAVALSEEGQSNLMVHADSPALEQIARLIEQPVTGIGAIDATVTGNRRELNASGTLTGNGIDYDNGKFAALSLKSDFTAKVAELDIRNASVSATTQGTFVTVAGQNVNELTAKTDYADNQVTFDASARQPQRMMSGAGSLVIHPDHQEVHLQRLSLETQGMTWQTAPASEATIQYGKDTVAVNNFTLMNGDQRISADGTYGRPGDSLKVVASNVDVSMVDALLLRAPQLSGRLNATSTISGTTEALHADTTFTISQGGFRRFQYDSLGGTVVYTPQALTLDTKLQQNPSTSLEAKGRIPTALLTGSGSTSEEPIDLRVDSTPIDVGLVQGFTTALSNVTGTLEAHIHVTGSAADPLPDGTITVQNAAFLLEPNGVTYTDLDGRIELQPDRIHIDEIRVLDNHDSLLTVTGDLALRERRVGEMSIAVKTTDFKVIDNELGNVRVDSDLRLTGQLNAPRVEGDLGVTTGQINLDPIVALLGSSAYSTEQTEFTTPQPQNAAAGAIPATLTSPPPALPDMSVVAENVQVDVNLTIPNDLVINASDLRAVQSPIGLGALNLTLGGDLYIHQVPYDQIRLYGSVKTIRGTYNFQGRRFTILRDGTLRFDGLDELNPDLDIRTERIIQSVTANVNVRGTLRQPEIVLTSTPPLEEADILSLIVFNQPLNQLASGQQTTLAERAQGIATGALANGLANSIGTALNLDQFEISTAPDSGAAAELTIGQQVGQNLYVKLQQGIGDQGSTNFILEYELTEWMRLQTNVRQNTNIQQQMFQRIQGTGVDLLFFLSY